MEGRFSPDEIDAIAARAGLPLTPEWRAAFVHGSQFIVQITRLIRTRRSLSAEPAHVFNPPSK